MSDMISTFLVCYEVLDGKTTPPLAGHITISAEAEYKARQAAIIKLRPQYPNCNIQIYRVTKLED